MMPANEHNSNLHKPRQIIDTGNCNRKELLRRAQEIGRKHRKLGEDPVGDLIRERARDDAGEEKTQQSH